MAERERAATVSHSAFAGRLVIIGLIFGVALLVEIRGDGSYSERELHSLWALVVSGFGLAVVYGLLASYAGGFGLPLVELAGDGVLISGLIYCTGGARSLFGFLYLIWIVHAAVRSGPRAAIATSAVATVTFGVMISGAAQGWLPAFEAANLATEGESLHAMGTHTLAFVAVTVLAHQLSRQVKVGKDELYELGEIHQRIFDNVSSGLLTLNPLGRITSFNREAERITGYSAEEVRAWPLEQLFPNLRGAEPVAGRTTDEEGASLASSAPSPKGDGSRAILRFSNRKSEERHLGFSRSNLTDDAGRFEGSVLIFQDLTQVVEMEEQLRRSERLSAVGQLAAGLAHEIRNPLASLSGAIELLASDLPDPDPSSRRLVRIVQRETARLNRLVGDFLSYAGPGPVRREVVPVRELLEEIGQLIGNSDCAGVELCLEVPRELAVLGNPDQLRQVFWNLVLNAAEAEPPDRKVRVAGETLPPQGPEGDLRAVIEIVDRGSGIPPEILERVFEPFYTTKPKGTGLGLATVHRVVEAHGGQLLVKSRPGEGTSVRVVLPAATT